MKKIGGSESLYCAVVMVTGSLSPRVGEDCHGDYLITQCNGTYKSSATINRSHFIYSELVRLIMVLP